MFDKFYLINISYILLLVLFIYKIFSIKKNIYFMEKKLNDLEYYDLLTNLPNRKMFFIVLKEVICQLKKENKIGALYLIDIDNFKRINGLLNYSIGDKVLNKVSLEIKNIISEEKEVFRFGEDEFLILQKNVKNLEEVEEFNKVLLKNLNINIPMEDKNVYLSVSIGSTIFPNKEDKVEDVLKRVDMAMYRAKELGKGRYEFYDCRITKDMIRRYEIERKLRYAINNNELEIYYQPQINLIDGSIMGLEALLRWNDQELGYVSPSEFISIAEETELINDLDDWVIEEVCKRNSIWKSKGYNYGYISVNVSSIQFMGGNFINNLSKYDGILLKELQLEITENVLIKSLDNSREILKILKNMDIRIALDDFGKGYSSLNYLRTLPIDTLKLDKSFIDNICFNDNEKFVVRAIIKLAHELNMIVVAEGIEGKEQVKVLKEMNCDKIQGYYFSKPISEKEMEKLLMRDYKYKISQ